MLEEIIACFLSFFSALTLDAPQLSREMNHNASSSEEITHYTWEDKIHKDMSLQFRKIIYHHQKQAMCN